jgi:hypothetical protein
MYSLLPLLLLLTLTLQGYETHIKNVESRYCHQMPKGDPFCMVYTTEYPLIRGVGSDEERVINRVIESHISKKDPQIYVKEYLKEVEGEVFRLEHSDETKISILSITPRTFTLIVGNALYAGGAHGMHASMAYNYDLTSGKQLTLDDLFVANYKKRLTRIAESHYRKEEGLLASDDLVHTRGWFENIFVLSQSVGIGEEGLHLHYNPYEIKAYALGTTSFVLPYELIERLIPTDSYLSPFLQNAKSGGKKQTIKRQFEVEGIATIEVRVERLTQRRVLIDVDVLNHIPHHQGGISLSFPQLQTKEALLLEESYGLDSLMLYPAKSRLYYAPTKKTIKGAYLLVEGDAKKWKRGEKKGISLMLKPSRLHTLDLYVRATFKRGGEIIAMPLEGVKGQQGFANYHITIPLHH